VAGAWWIGESELDDDQKAVIGLSAEGSHLVLGPPGSGKTNILLLRAKYLTRELQSLVEKRKLTPHFDAVLLDEAQDYTSEEIGLFKKLSRQLFAVADSRQRIFSSDDAGSPLDALRQAVDEAHTLRYHYRNGLNICGLLVADLGGDLCETQALTHLTLEQTHVYHLRDFAASSPTPRRVPRGIGVLFPPSTQSVKSLAGQGRQRDRGLPLRPGALRRGRNPFSCSHSASAPNSGGSESTA
jgi:hypothetical protein